MKKYLDFTDWLQEMGFLEAREFIYWYLTDEDRLEYNNWRGSSIEEFRLLKEYRLLGKFKYQRRDRCH